jgi:hypothetical protein
MRIPVALVLLTTACGRSTSSALVTIDTLPGGIIRVMNHAPSEWADTNGWRLVLERTIQPAPGEPGELGIPSAMALHPNGDLVVRDNQPTVLRRYWADGDSVTEIAREGDGPGEYRDPVPAFVGDTLVVQDQKRALLLLYAPDGTLLRQFPSICCQGVSRLPVLEDGRVMIRSATKTADDPFVAQWVVFDLTGRRLDSVRTPAMPRWTWEITRTFPGGGVMRRSRPVPFSGAAEPILRRVGDQLSGAGTENVVLVTRSGLDTTRILGRDDQPPVALPPGMRDSVYAEALAQEAALADISNLADIPDHFPFWSSIHEDGRNDIWLLTEPGPGGPGQFDVYTPDGVLRGSVPAPAMSEYPRFAWAGDRVAILDTDGDDLPRIRIYRIDQGQ